jgi:DnaK suppressor protein
MGKTATPDLNHVRELRRLLEDQRRRILDALRTKAREAQAEEAIDDGELPATERWESDVQAEFESALLQMQNETLAHVEEVLGRLRSGIFGSCADCGSQIPAPRLKVLPFAIRCRPCEKQREALTRSHDHPSTIWQVPD